MLSLDRGKNVSMTLDVFDKEQNKDVKSDQSGS